jgi:HAD superfamily hydrolase (TIGR01509 family)
MTTPIAELPDPAAVVFDLDGTLVDTNEARIEAWLETFREVDLRATRDTLVPLIGLDGKRLAREVAALNALVIDDHRAEEIDKRCGELFDRRNRDPKPLPGVTALVDVIEARHIPWSIATSSRKDQVGASVDALGLRNEPRIVDASHVQHAKPEPDLLLRAAEELGLDPARCWYIGDSPWDMVASVAAAMIPIGVTAGAVVGRPQLEGAGAAAVVETLDEVAATLRERAVRG